VAAAEAEAEVEVEVEAKARTRAWELATWRYSSMRCCISLYEKCEISVYPYTSVGYHYLAYSI